MQDHNFAWMRTVSPEEAKACCAKLEEWAKTDETASGKGALGEWVYSKLADELFKSIFHITVYRANIIPIYYHL
jgi:hypothetical protein